MLRGWAAGTAPLTTTSLAGQPADWGRMLCELDHLLVNPSLFRHLLRQHGPVTRSHANGACQSARPPARPPSACRHTALPAAFQHALLTTVTTQVGSASRLQQSGLAACLLNKHKRAASATKQVALT